MNYKILTAEISAILVSWLILAMPLAAATNVNILFNDQIQATAQISPTNLVNKQINIIHDPADVSWSEVKVLVTASSASLAKSITKIYLYKCKLNNPVDCIRTEPLVFDQYIDTELSWSDISQPVSAAFYPEDANLLLLIKLEGEGKTTWAGFWDKIVRTDYNIFDTFSYELNSLDVHASSLDMVEPIKSFIENYQMIPFNWADKAEFTGANLLFGIGGNKADLDQSPPALQTAQPAINYITAIAKEYFFILPKTTSGVTNPITLNLNPTFTCGNDFCEPDLGETTSNCCYDCSCQSGYYCDLINVNVPTSGSCKNSGAIALEVIPAPIEVSDCTQTFTAGITARIQNSPKTLAEELRGVLTLNATPYPVSCSGSLGQYNCPVTLTPQVDCGTGSYTLSPNSLKLTLNYNDGPNTVAQELSSGFPIIGVNYDCVCEEGYYCDSGTLTCKTGGAISLTIVSVNSYIENYNPAGDMIDIKAKVNNPPTDLSVVGTTYILGSLWGDGQNLLNRTSGSITCAGGAQTGYVYNCSIPFSISNYDHTKAYYFKENNLNFSVSYSNGPVTVTGGLSTAFSDITIPSYRCGDGTCNPEEDQDNCCFDCGCPSEDYFCDSEKSCQLLNDVRLIVESVYPTQLKNCRAQHEVDMIAKVENVPSDVNLERAIYTQAGKVSVWPFACKKIDTLTGASICSMSIPPIDCEPGPNKLGPNEVEFTISFSDGPDKATKTMSAPFEDIWLDPTWACGEYGCETDYGESATNCCLDCPCKDDLNFGSDYYCDFDSKFKIGECKSKTNIELKITSPTATQHFDSCEKSNILDIEAVIKNQPTGMRLENSNIILNNTNVRVDCQTSQPGLGNMTLKCPLTIRRRTDCVNETAYIYKNNSLAITITYPDGAKTVMQSISDDFKNVEISQSYESIYQMTRRATDDIKVKLADTKATAVALMKWMEDCMEIQKVLAMFSMVAMVSAGVGGMFKDETVGGIAGLIAGFGSAGGIANILGLTTDLISLESGLFAGAGALLGLGAASAMKGAAEGATKTAGSNWGTGMTAVATTSQVIMNIWAKMCDAVQQQYKMNLEMQKMQMEFITAQLCFDMMQHQFDIGACDKQGRNCYSEIISCVNTLNFESYMDNIQGYSDKIQKDVEGIGESMVKAAETWQELALARGTYASFTMSCEGTSGDKNCCGLKRLGSIESIGLVSWGGKEFAYEKVFTKPANIKITSAGIAAVCKSPHETYIYVTNLNSGKVEHREKYKQDGVEIDYGTAYNFFDSLNVLDDTNYKVEIICRHSKTGQEYSPVAEKAQTITYCPGVHTTKSAEDPCANTDCAGAGKVPTPAPVTVKGNEDCKEEHPEWDCWCDKCEDGKECDKNEDLCKSGFAGLFCCSLDYSKEIIKTCTVGEITGHCLSTCTGGKDLGESDDCPSGKTCCRICSRVHPEWSCQCDKCEDGKDCETEICPSEVYGEAGIVCCSNAYDQELKGAEENKPELGIIGLKLVKDTQEESVKLSVLEETKIKIKWGIKNTGADFDKKFSVDIFVDDETEPIYHVDKPDGLKKTEGGEYGTYLGEPYEYDTKGLSAGEHTIKLAVDLTNVIGEVDDENNMETIVLEIIEEIDLEIKEFNFKSDGSLLSSFTIAKRERPTVIFKIITKKSTYTGPVNIEIWAGNTRVFRHKDFELKKNLFDSEISLWQRATFSTAELESDTTYKLKLKVDPNSDKEKNEATRGDNVRDINLILEGISSNCDYAHGWDYYPCTLEKDCKGKQDYTNQKYGFVPGGCPQFKTEITKTGTRSNKWYKQLDGKWFEYTQATQPQDSVSGDNILCCITKPKIIVPVEIEGISKGNYITYQVQVLDQDFVEGESYPVNHTWTLTPVGGGNSKVVCSTRDVSKRAKWINVACDINKDYLKGTVPTQEEWATFTGREIKKFILTVVVEDNFGNIGSADIHINSMTNPQSSIAVTGVMAVRG